eukprot:TRINITY_DN18657_c0_g1_i1.p1 TRINITY_DN18657_c0_g1~~TRINITY_DN18657_c0_g1_i1.p1  ORF type:complete len:168 (+),score=51.10 TRINITY_DN18657_c0_g1_i1:136-639(+)
MPSSPPSKITIRGKTSMSLHERFTALRGLSTSAVTSKTTKDRPTAPLYVPKSSSPSSSSSSKGPQFTAPSPSTKSAAMKAALKIQEKPLRQRIGSMSRPAGITKRAFPKGKPQEKGPRKPQSSLQKKPLQRRPPQKPSKDELDAQLDSYMSSTKSLLVEETDYSPME